MKISAGYNLVNATSRSNDGTFGNRLARRAKDSANASIDWKTPIGLAVAADVLLTGDSFDDLANTVRLNGYQIVTVRASYPVSDRFEVFGRIENLFDESYQTVARYSTYGRNAYVGVRAKF